MSDTIRAYSRTFNGICRQIRSEAKISSQITLDGTLKESESLSVVWDTGATVTCISEQVAKQMQLASVRKVRVHGVDGPTIKDSYIIDLFFPNDVTFHNLQVNEGKLGDIDLLIGMDVISQGDFAISNYQGKTVFSYRKPSVNILDFVSGVKLMGAMRKNGSRSTPKRRKK